MKAISNGDLSVINVSESSSKLYRKSKNSFNFTRGKAETPKKQPSKKLNVTQKRAEKKIKDLAIAKDKQKKKDDIKEQIENTLDLFYKVFKSKKS